MKPNPEPLAKGADSSSRATETPRPPGTGTPGLETPPFAVPDHTLLRRIGKGSYGEVWLAQNALGTWRAVKIVRRSAFDTERPYEREFSGIQQFEPISRSHESQLNILQVGRVEDGFYYVMELADDMGRGRDIDEGTYTPRDLRSELHLHGRLPVSDCMRLGLALTTALEHLHKHGLVHRDIKPSNIVFVNGIPKLADIGLVAQAEATMSFVGTEGFVPPEGPGTPQADIYSLGKVLYELSTGHDRHQFPELPTGLESLPDGNQLGELNEVLLKACQRNPAERYQTAAEMHADLALLDSGRSVVRLRGIERRLRFVQRAGAIVTLIAALAAGLYLWQARQTRIVHELVQEKSRLAEEKTKLADTNERLADENRKRIVRLDVANGVRLLDSDDPAGALLWFTDALKLVTNNAAEESIHRIRVQQTLKRAPFPSQVFPHGEPVTAFVFSPDGKRFATGTESGRLHLWETETGAKLLNPDQLKGGAVRQIGFTSDGKRLLASTVFAGGVSPAELNRLISPPKGTRTASAAIIDVPSGKTVFSRDATNVSRAEFVADGRWLATIEPDHVIRVYDVGNGSQLAALRGHTNQILNTSYSADGTMLASTSDDGTVRLWRLPTGEPVGAPIPYEQPWRRFPAVLSPDGQRLATSENMSSEGLSEHAIVIWRTDDQSRVGKPIEAHGAEGSYGFLKSARGLQLLDLFDNRIRVLDADTQADLIRPIPLGGRQLHVHDANPDNRRLVIGDREGIFGVRSLDSGEMQVPAFRFGTTIREMGLSPDGSRLAVITDEGACVLWELNIRDEDALHRFDKDLALPWAAKSLRHGFSPDRTRLMAPLSDGNLRLIDVERMETLMLPKPVEADSAPDWTFAPDNHQWAIAYVPTNRDDATVLELWRDKSGTLTHQAPPQWQGIRKTGFARGSAVVELVEDARGLARYAVPQKRSIKDMRFAPDSSRLLAICNDGQVRAWRTSDGALDHAVAAPESLECANLLPDGRTLFAIDQTAGYSLFDMVTGVVMPIPIGRSTVTSLAFDVSSERLVTTTEEQWARVWNPRTGEPLTLPVRHDGPVCWAEWSPDGKRVAIAGLTPEIKVWDASSGDLSLPPLRLGNKSLITVMWSLDGRFLVARSNDNLVRAWDAVNGEPVTPVLKHNDYIVVAQLAANNRLVTLSSPNIMRAWDLKETRLPVDVLSDFARLASGRTLNAAGTMLSLKPQELAELCRSLRQRAPQLFQ